MDDHKTIADIAPETRVMAGMLGRLGKPDNADSIVTDQELSEAVGFDIRQRPWLLQSARAIAEREHNIAIERDRERKGYRRLRGAALNSIGDSTLQRVGRASRRASKRMMRAATNEVLSDEDCRRMSARMTVLNLTAMFSSGSRVDRLESKMNQSADVHILPESVVLKLFNNGKE